MDLINLGKQSLQALDSLRSIYKSSQEARWKIFVYGCQKALENYGQLNSKQDLQLLDLFQKDFAKSHAYDFIRKLLDANSQIGQLAMSRLYIRCATRKFPHATYDETVLLRAYTDVDDRDVNILLEVVDLLSKISTDPHAELSKMSMPSDRLEMSSVQFGERRSLFSDLGCIDHYELSSVMESFCRRQVFTSTVGGFTSYEGDAFCIVKNSRSNAFIEDLTWAKVVSIA